jgi:hypothetical protein
VRRLFGFVVATIILAGLGLFGLATAAQGSSGDSAVAHWQAQLAQDSSLPQEGYLQTQNGKAVGNDYWGQCHQDAAYVHQEDCPNAGTPQAESYVLQVRQNIARDKAQLAAAEAALRG